MKTIDPDVGKLEAQLAHWGAKLDQLVADANKTDAEAKVDYHKRVDSLKAKYEVAQAKVAELREGGSEKWDSFKDGIEIAWKDLESAFKELAN